MSASETPEKNAQGDNSPQPSPRHFLIPSPIPCRRTRTYSASERAAKGPEFRGKIRDFCREKGHGFIIPDDGTDPIFVHISDIDGDFVPKPGDTVGYKKCLIPPKNEKMSAVHVRIVRIAEGTTHERWDSPRTPSPKES